MKRHVQIILLALSIALIGCQEYVPEKHFISVIIDRSEMDSYRPKMEDILSYLPDPNDADAITLSLCYISDTQYGPRYSFSLPTAETGWLSNEDKRRRTRRSFFKQFQDSLRHYNSRQLPLRRSDIIRVVLRELEEAPQLQCDVDILLFSDLKEHSSLFSVYNPNHKKQLLFDANTTLKRLISEIELPENLSGITLRIIFQPSIEDTAVFTAMVGVYKNIIESRGGKVIVGHEVKFEKI